MPRRNAITSFARSALTACTLVLFVIASCTSDRESASTSTSPTPVTTPPSPSTVATKPAAQAAPTSAALPEADVRAVLDRWLAAQNTGDFAAYESLFAERFTGLKRIGQRSQRFDRKGWMRDRRRMFDKPMSVEASDIAITTTPVTGSVRFIQTWSSGKFKDRGDKLLHVVRDKSGLRIANESMLSSVIEAGVHQDALNPDDLRVVLHTPAAYVVLGEASSAVQATGAPRLATDDYGHMAVIKTPRPDTVPADMLAAQGKTLTLFGRDGQVCKAKVGPPSLMRRATPHWYGVQIWKGEAEIEEHDQPVPPAQVAEGGWEEGGELTLLVAPLEAISGDCTKAYWARATDRPAPVVFSRQPLDPKLAALAERTVRALPAYAKLAREYREYTKAVDPETAKTLADSWEAFDGAKPTYDLWTHGGRKLVQFHASAGGCGDFGGQLWALFEVSGDQLVLLNRPGSNDEPNDFFVDAIVDANGDGLIELLGSVWNSNDGETNVLLRVTAQGVKAGFDLSPPYHDCGC